GGPPHGEQPRRLPRAGDVQGAPPGQHRQPHAVPAVDGRAWRRPGYDGGARPPLLVGEPGAGVHADREGRDGEGHAGHRRGGGPGAAGPAQEPGDHGPALLRHEHLQQPPLPGGPAGVAPAQARRAPPAAAPRVRGLPAGAEAAGGDPLARGRAYPVGRRGPRRRSGALPPTAAVGVPREPRAERHA
ncbi:unnamed protein product, partial [Ectocarpus fasciculatus]